MRLVDLRKKGVISTPFNSIMKYGCGPNFVLNRKGLFKQMIEEQGEIFWFRFWLSFCFQPAYDPFEPTLKNYRVIQHLWCENIHENILQVSDETAATFCLDVAVSSLLQNVKLENPLENPSLATTVKIYDEIKHLVAEFNLEKYQVAYVIQPNFYFSMAFGVALCEVFCKWLNAPQVGDDATNYWTIPDVYLDADFPAEYLETYMACRWRDKLYTLLGVSEKQVPWLVRLLEHVQTNECRFDFKQQIKAIRFTDNLVEKKGKRTTICATRETMMILKKKIKKKDEYPRDANGRIRRSPSRIQCIRMYLARKLFVRRNGSGHINPIMK